MKRLLVVLALVFSVSCLVGCESESDAEQNEDAASASSVEALVPDKGQESAMPEESEQADSGYYGALTVVGSDLCDAEGAPVQLRGLSTHGLSWFPQFVNKEAMSELRHDWSTNVFRLAMYTAEYNGYCTGDDANRASLKALIDEAVAASRELDMYLIIDWHILSDGSPLTYKTEAAAFFSEMAEKYKDEEHVIYEICNEPNGGTTWEEIKGYAEEIIPLIRAHTDAVVLVGTPTWSQEIDKAAANPITDFENVMYALHFYAATHKDDLRNRLVAAVEGGLPVFVSEFGICDASGNGAIDEDEADAWLEIMDSHNVSYIMWSFANKDESASAILSSCQKTSGFTQDDLSQSGLWFYSRHAGGDALHDSGPQPAKTPATTSNGDSSLSENNVSVKLADSWESGGAKCYRYDVSFKNATNQAVSTWEIKITFSGEPVFQQGWNGKYAVSGTMLTITPESYNGAVENGGSASGIGFIIEGPANLKVEAADLVLG